MKKIIRHIANTLLRISEFVLIVLLVSFMIEGASSLVFGPQASDVWAGIFLITIVVYIFCWNKNAILWKLLSKKQREIDHKKDLLKRKIPLLKEILGTEKFEDLKIKDAESILSLFDLNFNLALYDLEKTTSYAQYKKRIEALGVLPKGEAGFHIEKQKICEFYIENIIESVPKKS